MLRSDRPAAALLSAVRILANALVATVFLIGAFVSYAAADFWTLPPVGAAASLLAAGLTLIMAALVRWLCGWAYAVRLGVGLTAASVALSTALISREDMAVLGWSITFAIATGLLELARVLRESITARGNDGRA